MDYKQLVSSNWEMSVKNNVDTLTMPHTFSGGECLTLQQRVLGIV